MEKYLSVSELMKSLGIGRSSAYNLINYPGFPSTRIGKRVVISERALQEWLARGGTEPRDSRSA